MSSSVSNDAARAELDVMISGGFSLAYRQLLPAFERTTGIAVATASAASQGTGPNTMKAQLERGARADVVILSREGLSELVNVPGIAFVSQLPAEVQLLQVFAAAMVAGSDRREQAKQLIEFLASREAAPAIEQSGMEPLGLRPTNAEPNLRRR